MARTYSLAHLTALSLSPPELVRLAARTGYAAAGLRLLPAVPGGVHYPLMDDPALLRETRAVVRDTGVPVLDLEVARIDARFDIADFLHFFDAGARLGARHVLVAGDDPDPARMTASFAAFCAAAAARGLTADLEFMPWLAVRDAATAHRIVAGAAQPNGGVLVDALHFGRSGSTLEQIGALPRAWLHYAQICDGAVPGPPTVDGMIHDARCERLLPGEGGIPLRALFGRLPPAVPVSVEVPSESQSRTLGHEAWSRAALAASMRVLETSA